MKATITHLDEVYDHCSVRVGSHHLEIGSDSNSGFCYEHGSFDCKLTAEENDAITQALRTYSHEAS